MCDNREEFSIVRMVKVQNVSVSGYHKWMSRINMPPNERELENIELLEEIKEIYYGYRGVFGSRKTHLYDYMIAYNLLNRNFETTTPGQKMVSDTTVVETVEGDLYDAVATLDIHGRLPVGLSMDRRNNSRSEA